MRHLFLILAMALLSLTGAKADTPRAEYPRPQFERSQWLNLNGTWSYTFDFGKSGVNRDFRNSKGFDNNILVPFCPESKLSGVQYTDFINCMWYQRTWRLERQANPVTLWCRRLRGNHLHQRKRGYAALRNRKQF